MFGIRSLALFAARVILGIIFIAHGWQKLNQMGIDQVQTYFKSQGVPAPEIAAYYATWVEFVGGILLILGLLLPLVSVLLIIDMIGAIIYVHADAGFWNTDKGYEWPLALIAGLLAVGFAHAGAAAADHHLFRRRRRRSTHAVE
ncbi:DoxX family protein [Gordonia sinesedis]